MNASLKRSIVFLFDSVVVAIAWFGAYAIRDNVSDIDPTFIHKAFEYFPYVLLIQLVCAWWFGLYRGVWRFASIPDLLRIFKCVLTGTGISMYGFYLSSHIHLIPRSIFMLYAMMLLLGWGGSRFVIRLIREHWNHLNEFSGERVLIVGAGSAAEGLLREMTRLYQRAYRPVGLLDDNTSLIGKEIHGVRVLGTIDQMVDICQQQSVKVIFLALPSATSKEMRRIVSICEKIDIPFHTLPSLSDLADGRVSIHALRKVSIEDLLGREPVDFKHQHLSLKLKDKCVFITGAGGSIGSELSRQVASIQPKNVVLIDHSEYHLYKIEHELKRKFPQIHLIPTLIDIKDDQAMEELFDRHRPQWLFHSAAYKHVPLLESHPVAALKNNVYGTWVLAKLASMYQCEKFIYISTDKAVNPSSLMGTSKRAAEKICDYFSQRSQTEFMTVRFGNVFGSAGSVLPLFHKQLAEGGPITVTHPEIERYFMTIPEASHLILQAAFIGKGGEIFVLDMGEPVKIASLAKQMIHLSGKQLNKDIKIDFIGLRPGEKLQEELFYTYEKKLSTTESKIMIASHPPYDHSQTEAFIQAFTKRHINSIDAKILLKGYVSEYKGQDLHAVIEAQSEAQFAY